MHQQHFSSTCALQEQSFLAHRWSGGLILFSNVTVQYLQSLGWHRHGSSMFVHWQDRNVQQKMSGICSFHPCLLSNLVPLLINIHNSPPNHLVWWKHSFQVARPYCYTSSMWRKESPYQAPSLILRSGQSYHDRSLMGYPSLSLSKNTSAPSQHLYQGPYHNPSNSLFLNQGWQQQPIQW